MYVLYGDTDWKTLKVGFVLLQVYIPYKRNQGKSCLMQVMVKLEKIKESVHIYGTDILGLGEQCLHLPYQRTTNSTIGKQKLPHISPTGARLISCRTEPSQYLDR